MSDRQTLPEGWSIAPLEELIVFLVGGDWGKSPETVDANYVDALCIRASEVKDWDTARGATAALRKVKKASLIARQLMIGDIVVEISGGGPEQPVGRTLLIDEACLAHNLEIPKICTNFFRLMRPSSEINAGYLNWFLRYFYRTSEINGYQGGSNNLRNLKFNQYLTIPVPVPPKYEQDRIVKKIEELFSEVDKGVESLRTALEQLEAYRHGLLKYAFEGKLTKSTCMPDKLPSEWPLMKVQELLAEPLANGRSVRDRLDGFPVLRLTAFKNGHINLSERKAGDWNRDAAAPFIVKKHDFFVARGNGSKHLVGIGGLVTESLDEVAFPDTMIRLRLKSDLVDHQYFSHCWNSRVLRDQIEKAARTTAGIYKINQNHIETFVLPVPPLEAQHEIVILLDGALEEIQRLSSSLKGELYRSTALRQSILKRGLSGHLVPQNVKDEPVSELLERIRSERVINSTQTQKHKRRTKGEAA